MEGVYGEAIMNLKDELTYYVEFVFPLMAVKHNWPIRFDHCFRRVIYDNCVGDVWSSTIPAPAQDNLSTEQLEKCIELCKQILENPPLLRVLNNKSLSYRAKLL
jgi:hypothetical protein